MLKFATDYLSGTPITESETQSVSSETDMFLVSHPIFPEGCTDRYKSMHVTYKTLCDQLTQDLSDKLGIGTMAYANSDDFALSSHHHECYGKSDVDSFIDDPSDYPEGVPGGNTVISAAKFIIDGKETVVRAVLPTYYPISVFTPVGTISYVGWPAAYIQNHVIDPFADDFDGWVYCDGRTITCDSDQFSEAQIFFNGSKSSSATSFTVPLLTGFQFLDGHATSISHSSTNHLDLAQHTHYGSFKVNAQLQISASFVISKDAAQYSSPKFFGISSFTYTDEGKSKKIYYEDETLHAKYYNGTMHAYASKTAHPNMPLYANVSFTDGCQLNDSTAIVGKAVNEFGEAISDDDQIFWPNHQYMVPLVYIGKKKAITT